MSQQRIFSSEELATLGKLTLELVEDAVDAGETEKAKKLSRRMYKEFLSMHDLYRDWVTALLTFIGRRYGDSVLSEALRYGCQAWLEPLCDKYEGQDTRRKAQMMIAGLRGHLQALTVQEDEEKVTVVMDTCGSGGRLVEEGAYGPPRDFLKIQTPQPMTFGRSDFPVYCAHCHFQNCLPVELRGKSLFVTEPSDEPGVEPCRIHLYKK